MSNFPLPNDPDSCEALADYFEAQAAQLRARAAAIKESGIQFAARSRNILKAGRLAAELIADGIRERDAINEVAIELYLPLDCVQANLRKFRTWEKEKARAEELARAEKLRKDGLSIRKIADKLDAPKSRISRLLAPAARKPSEIALRQAQRKRAS